MSLDYSPDKENLNYFDLPELASNKPPRHSLVQNLIKILFQMGNVNNYNMTTTENRHKMTTKTYR